MSNHVEIACPPQHKAQFHQKSWSDEFRCPTCGRAKRFNTNYLGQNHVVCDGVRFTKKPGTWRMGSLYATGGAS